MVKVKSSYSSLTDNPLNEYESPQQRAIYKSPVVEISSNQLINYLIEFLALFYPVKRDVQTPYHCIRFNIRWRAHHVTI